MAPDGGIGADLHDAVAFAIPAGHGHALPWRGLVGQHLGQGRQALALGARPSDSAGPARRGRLVKGGVEAQAGDAGDPLPDQGGQELEGGEAAVGHQHQLPPGHPAAGLQHQLPPPVGELLVPPPALAAVPLRGGEGRQERQRPDPPRPGDRHQQHQAEPAQAAGLDEVAAAGADRIPVDPLGADALAAPALDRVVEAEEHRTVRREGVEQQPEQQA